MLVINLNSQLGNQMFQYALFLKLKKNNLNIKFDVHYFTENPSHYALDLFNINIPIATTKEIQKVRDEYRSYYDRIRRKLFGKKNTIFEEVTSKTLCYKPDIFLLKSGYIDGYWQSECYFKDIREELIEVFKFPKMEDSLNLSIAEAIKKTNSVSIHIRRGDYVNGFPLLDKNYYDRAIKIILDKYPNSSFFVFSNDIAWAKENIIASNVFFVEWNIGRRSINDMYLMSLCKHNIIANSSFSWWGAWLNNNINKLVIAPKIWFYHQETPDIYCENWLVI